MFERQEYRTNDHSPIINTYLDYNISKESIFLPICSLLSLFFIYQKINEVIMVKWQATLYPLYLFFIIEFIKCFLNIIKTEKEEEDDDQNYKLNKFNLPNIDKISLISNLFRLLDSALAFGAIFYFGEYLDKRKDPFLFSSIFVVFLYGLSRISYSLIRKTSMFAIYRPLCPSNDPLASEPSALGFITSLTTPVLTYLSNMMIICNGGVCTQLYMSTFSSLLGAFGVSLSEINEYLLPLTVVLLGISLLSLWWKHKRLTHKPFLLGVFGCVLIIISHIFEKTSLYYLIYPGNVLMIGAAIWNAKTNKFSGLPRFKK